MPRIQFLLAHLSVLQLQGLLESATWEEALVAAKDAISKVKGNEMSFIAGKLADAESLIALKVYFASDSLSFEVTFTDDRGFCFDLVGHFSRLPC